MPKRVPKETYDREKEWVRWCKLIRRAKNFPRCPKKKTVEITVKKVLGIGHLYFKPPEVAVVSDTRNRIWLIPETHKDDRSSGKTLRGLVSRYNVRPGMKLRLKLQDDDIRAFPLTPELES